MEFRRARPEDIDQIQALAIDGMRPDLYPAILDPFKIRSTIDHFVHSRDDFSLAAFEDGKVVGAIAAAVSPALWFERSEAHVVMCYAKTPNIGHVFIESLMEWVNESFLVRTVIWPMEIHSRPGFARLLRRYGFQSQTLCVYRK